MKLDEANALSAAASPSTPDEAPLLTRGQALTTKRPDGVTITPAHTGIEVADERLGVQIMPLADGRLALQVIAYPAATGFKEACGLLQTDARRDFAPEAVRLEGSELVCLGSSPWAGAAALREGFVLQLTAPMASALAPWLPRLVRVAEAAHPIAQRVEAHLKPSPSAHGVGVCVDLVSAILLDGWSVEEALDTIGRHHWTMNDPAWRAALGASDVRQLLDAVAQRPLDATRAVESDDSPRPAA